VQRIELWTTIAAGVSGGLLGTLCSGLIASFTQVRPRPGTAPPGEIRTLALSSVLRAAAGAALGFLFWLGWGLIALAGWPWYAVGLLYGALCWAALVAPALASLALQSPGAGRPAAVHAADWLVTCLAIGMLCALSWHRYG
jgi:hypothetical protein